MVKGAASVLVGVKIIPTRLYVIGINAKSQQVIVGPQSALAVKNILLKDINWLGDDKLSDRPYDIKVKIRSAMQPVAAIVNVTEIGDVKVSFKAGFIRRITGASLCFL